MAPMMFLALFLAKLSVSDAAWCVCRQDVSIPALQKTIDYACGSGADCSLILQNGACYNPNTVISHCSYAANSYYQKKGQAQGACDFAGTAIITQTDPSNNGCSYPATQSSAGSSTVTGNSTQSPGSTLSSGGFTPAQTGAGVLGGLGPSGTATNNFDGSHAAFLPYPNICSSFPFILLSALLFQSL